MKNKLTTAIFFNHCFDKRRFQNFLYWFFKKSYFGQLRSQPPKRKLLKFLERLKFLGFHSATQAGFSMSIDDLKIPSSKSEILLTAENIVLEADLQLISGNLTIIERYQRIIEIWNRTSEELKYQVLQSFKISDFLNPVYLMAFSGARGNISQIRQLVGMRGLMADPQGQIIDFPIRSNFREGLTLTEYLISCSGARKGIVDTALRTAASGYLTRRLVDVAHHVIVHQMDCQSSAILGPLREQPNQEGEPVGIWIEDLYDQQKKILPLQQRLIGRVLAETIISSSETTNFAQAPHQASPKAKSNLIIGQKNHEISKMTSQKICQYRKRVFIRSPLTCQSSKFICQLCYGWNLSEGQFVSVGEAVGVLAAQSIGEPGTQLTMRTFHTGGVFTGILMDQTYAPFSGMAHYHFPCNGLLIRTLQGKIAYLSKNHGILSISQGQKILPSRRFQNQKALAFGFILKNRPVLGKASVQTLLVSPSGRPKSLPIQNKTWLPPFLARNPLQQKRSRGSSPLSRMVEPQGAKRADRLGKAQWNYKTLLYQLRKLKGQFKELIFFNPRKAPKGRVKVRQMSARGLGLSAPRTQVGKLQKQIQLIFQNFTILYVRQNEKVLQKQLIAELPFFENEKSLENEQEILSNESGEIYFWDIVFLEKTISDFKSEALTFKKNFVQNLGGFWILFGRSFQHILMGRSPFFKKLDLIDQNVPFSQIQIESNYFLNNEIDDLAKAQFLQFEQIFLSSSFLKKKKTNHKGRIFKQPLVGSSANQAKAKTGLLASSPLKGAGESNSDEYIFISKQKEFCFEIGFIFFKKWGYLRMTRIYQGPRSGPRRAKRVRGADKAGFVQLKAGPKFNFIKKIQIFNGIEPILTYFWNKKKVFWNDRPNFQSQKFETWMIGLQGQSKYMTFGSPSEGTNKYSDLGETPVIKVSKLKLQIHFLKQKEFCFKFKGLPRIPYIQNNYFRYHRDPIFLAKAQFQKQKRNFFFSDTGLILKKSKKFFCEFQNPHFFKKYKPDYVHRNNDQVQNQRSVLVSSADPITFPAKSENFFLNVNPENTCILLVNRQGFFQSFERKVLKNRMASFVTSPIQVRRWGWQPGVRRRLNLGLPPWGKPKAFFPLRWIVQVKDFLPIQDEASFRIGTQIFNKNKTKPIYKIQKSFCQWRAQTDSLFGRVLKDSFFPIQRFKKKDNNVVGFPQGGRRQPKERLYYWSLCTPLLPKNPFGYLDPKIQSIFCHLFLKQSRFVQNLPKNWARQIRNIQPKIIHWRNLPSQKYIFLLNFITHFDSAKYIKQKNLKKITGAPKGANYGLTQKTGASPEDQRDFVRPDRDLRFAFGEGSASLTKRPLGGQLHPKSMMTWGFSHPKPYYLSQVLRPYSKMDDFLEKIQRPKKRTFQSNPVYHNLQWTVEAFWRQKSKNHNGAFAIQTKNLLNIGFVPKFGFEADQSMTVQNPFGADHPQGPRSFRIKPYNFWKIQQRQEILRYPKFKMGFYSFIRIFFSMERFSFEDFNWGEARLYHQWHPPGGRPRRGDLPLGGQNTIYKNWAFAFASPRALGACPPRSDLQPFNRMGWGLPEGKTNPFFKILNIRRIRQKSSYICSGFRQRMPQIFSIDEQKRIFINWALANKKSGFILFLIQKLSGSALLTQFFIQKHTKILSLIPYKTVLNIQKNHLNRKNNKGDTPPSSLRLDQRDVGGSASRTEFLSAKRTQVSLPQDPEEDMSAPALRVLAPMAEGFRITGQRSINFNKKRFAPFGAPTKIPFTNFLNDHQQIFYGKFKKIFQNIHLNSIRQGEAPTNLLELVGFAKGEAPVEDPCIRWKFFGDGTKIFEKNIYSTYFKNFSRICWGLPEGETNKFNKTVDFPEWGFAKARHRPDRDWRKLKPLQLSKKKAQNSLGITYPSIHKVLVRSPDPKNSVGRSPSQELDRSHMVQPSVARLDASELDKSSTLRSPRRENQPSFLNKKYLFDQILPRSLVRSESGILKISKYNKLGFSQLQKWILDNYFHSYLLIIKNFFLLKNFENRFFQSRPKKPIYNQFYYYDNKIETEWISEYTQQVAVKKYKLQEDIIRQYSISSLRHHSQGPRSGPTWFLNSAKTRFMVNGALASDFLKNSNTMANKEAPDPPGLAVSPGGFAQSKTGSAPRTQVASPAAKLDLQDLFELPIHLYNFYIEYISKKSSRFSSGFFSLDLEKMDMKTWFNRLKNLQKYSRRYLKSPILSSPLRGQPSELEVRAWSARGKVARIPSLRYKKYWRKTIFFLQKLENNINKKKQYCFVFKWLKPLDHFYSTHFHHDFLSRQNRKSFRIPFLGSGEVWALAGDFSQNVSLRPPIVQKPRFFQQNIDIFRTALYFKTYPIFQTLLSIYCHHPTRWCLQALRRRDWTTDEGLAVGWSASRTQDPSETSFRKSHFHNLFNFISLQTEYLNHFPRPNRSKYFIPLLDKKFEIFLVSVVPILAQARSLRPYWRNQPLYSRPSDLKNKIKLGIRPASLVRVAPGRLDSWRLLGEAQNSSQRGGATILAWAGRFDAKAPWARPSSGTTRTQFVGHTFGVLYNQTHSLKIYIIKTKRLNFLTQKCLRVETVHEHFDQNRGFHLTNLLNLSKAKAAQQFGNLPFGQNGRNHPKLELQFQIIKRFLKRSGTSSPQAKPNLLHSSEIQIFIRFFLPFDSGEMLDPLRESKKSHQQGSLSILFANASDFFSYRQNHPIDLVRSDVPTGAKPLGQKFKYLLFEKIQNGSAKRTAKAKPPNGATFSLLGEAPAIILDRLQRQNKNKGSDVLSADRLRRPLGGMLRGPQKAMVSSPSDLDGLKMTKTTKNKIVRSQVAFGPPPSWVGPQGPSTFGGRPGGRVDRWKGLITPQQLCLSQKILDFYKLFPNFHSKIPAIMFFLKRKNIKTAGSQRFNLFKKSQKTPVVIGHHPNSLESPIPLGYFIRGLAANGRELSENLISGLPEGETNQELGSRSGPVQGGQFIAKTPHIFLFRKATTHLLNDQSILHVRHGDIILKNQPLCSVFYNQSKTGDIVQGIPKIEEIFEARKKSKYSLHELPIFSKDFLFFEKIIIKYLRSLQKSVVNNIQRIYCGQGIHISDKHIEIIVRQMTSNVFIREPGQTGLLYGEIVALQWISRINVISNQVIYEPVLMGMTKTCLETSSFLSAASFQETTRILGRAALQNQIDFIRGLKQNVILGNLIPIGTGCF